jgi:hypothetical protein
MARTTTISRRKASSKTKPIVDIKGQKTTVERVAVLERRVAALVKELKIARATDGVGLIAVSKDAREAAKEAAAAAVDAENARANLQDTIDKVRTIIDQWRDQVFGGNKR